MSRFFLLSAYYTFKFHILQSLFLKIKQENLPACFSLLSKIYRQLIGSEYIVTIILNSSANTVWKSGDKSVEFLLFSREFKHRVGLKIYVSGVQFPPYPLPKFPNLANKVKLSLLKLWASRRFIAGWKNDWVFHLRVSDNFRYPFLFIHNSFYKNNLDVFIAVIVRVWTGENGFYGYYLTIWNRTGLISQKLHCK